MAERTLGGLLAETRRRFAAAGLDDPGLEARILVGELACVAASDLIARPDHPVDAVLSAAVRAAAERRAGGEPVHRILGWRDFHGLRLALSPATLEPRPDTETLIEIALPLARAAAAAGACRILDLGTGTGAIALALLTAVPEASAVATDISAEALETASANARASGLAGRFRPLLSDWFDGIAEHFDLIVSNPPYIPSGDIASLDVEVRCHDPLAALDGGQDGLEAYRSIAKGAAAHLTSHGAVCVEIGFGQASDVERLFAAAGFVLVAARDDLAGIPRALCFLHA